MRQMIMLNIN